MNGKTKEGLTSTAVGCLGALLGLVAALSALVLYFSATWGGNDLALGFVLFPMALVAAPFGLVAGGVLAVRLRHSILVEHDEQRCRTRKLIAVLTTLATISLCFLAITSVIHLDDQPSDDELIANFKAHEAAFERLAHMSLEDSGLLRVDEDWTDPREPASIGVTADRLETYRNLFREAHVPRGLTRYDGNVKFMYWGIGSAVSDDISKGYTYMPKAPDRTRVKLDGFEPRDRAPETHYRWIRGNWYIYVSYIPG